MGASPFAFFAAQSGCGRGTFDVAPSRSIIAPSGCERGSGACMCPNLNISFAAVLTMSACVALPSPADAAVQRFTDEAGVVIYTIDDDGVVSMFESRPGTDITLSVTRGTREQMQPQITEITPQEVAAGTSTTLKIQGKNLSGATVKFSVPGIDVKPYAGKAKSVEIPLTISGSVPPGEIVMEVMTPIGSTTAKFKVTEFQIGGGGPTPKEGGPKGSSPGGRW